MAESKYSLAELVFSGLPLPLLMASCATANGPIWGKPTASSAPFLYPAVKRNWEDRSPAMWQNRDSVHFWQTLRGGSSSSVRCGHALFDTTGNRRSVWTSCKVAMAALFKYPSAFDLFCTLCKLKTDPTMILVIREAAVFVRTLLMRSSPEIHSTGIDLSAVAIRKPLWRL